MKKPLAIVTGDMHLRLNTPVCRTDDFIKAQNDKLEFIRVLQKKYNVPVLDAGDVFDRWKPSPELLSYTFEKLPSLIYTVPGNHDLPQNDMGQLSKSGIHCVTVAAPGFNILNNTTEIIPNKPPFFYVTGIGWRRDLDPDELDAISALGSKKVLISHRMVFKKNKPHWASKHDLTAKQMLKKYPQFDLIITGHNHTTFTEEMDGRVLINPGCLTRQHADEKDHEPCVFLWYAEDNKFEKVLLPFKPAKDVISKTVGQEQKEKSDRYDSFISCLKNPHEASLSFPRNVEKMIKENKISASVQKFIYQAMEEESL